MADAHLVAVPMKFFRLMVLLVLLGGALVSGVRQWREDLASVQLWRDASPDQRHQLLLLDFAPVIDRVTAGIPVNEGLVLIAGVDPALLPYYLHPRPIWQLQVEPETDRSYMTPPPSAYPRRDPAQLSGEWLLRLDRESLARGGELSPLRGVP